jgi:hypothetical protein
MGSAVILTIASFVCGCAANHSQPLGEIFGAYRDSRVSYYKATMQNPADPSDPFADVTSSTKRDRILWTFIGLIDQNYYNYSDALRRHKGYSDFGGSIASLGLNTAGTLVAGSGVKTTLAALAGAVTATKTSFNKDILLDQSIAGIIAKMDELRAQKKLEIAGAMQKHTEHTDGLNGYGLEQGVDDLVDYYNAGTMTYALEKMQKDSAVTEAQAKKDLTEKVKNLTNLSAGLGNPQTSPSTPTSTPTSKP